MGREDHIDSNEINKNPDDKTENAERTKKSEPVFHWLTREETIAGQKPDRRNRIGAGYADPTANTAIGNVYRLEMTEKRKKVKRSDGKRRESEPETATGSNREKDQDEGGDQRVQD